jgi:hypothetical protein
MRILLVLAGAGAVAGPLFAGEYSSWWGYRDIHLRTKGITAGPVTKYPLLVRFSGDELFGGGSQAMADGADLRFTMADGVTDIPFQIDGWTAGVGGSGAAWVLLDSVPADKDTAYSFRVYWGKPGSVSMSSPKATFDTANGYQAVFHLGTTAPHDTDASRGSLAARTGTSSAAGIIGNALIFETSDTAGSPPHYLTFPANDRLNNLSGGSYTMEAWALTNLDDSGNTLNRFIVSCGFTDYMHGTPTGYQSRIWLGRSGGVPNAYSADGLGGPKVPPGESKAWTYVSAVFDSTLTLWTIYRQRSTDPWGVPTDGSTTLKTGGSAPGPWGYYYPSGLLVKAGCSPWYIGASGYSYLNGARVIENRWLGKIDEIRISNVARDSNYIRLNFETQKATESPVTFGSGVVGLRPLPETRSTAKANVKLVMRGGRLLLERKSPDGRMGVYTLEGKRASLPQ